MEKYLLQIISKGDKLTETQSSEDYDFIKRMFDVLVIVAPDCKVKLVKRNYRKAKKVSQFDSEYEYVDSEVVCQKGFID